MSYKRGRGPFFAAIPFELQDRPDASAFHIATYAAIRRFADFGSTEGARPSDRRAAEVAGCSVRKFSACRNDLRAWGWIEWDSGAEIGTTNAYVVHASTEGGSAHGAEGGRQDVPTGSAHGADNREPGNREPDTEIVSPSGKLALSLEDPVEDPVVWLHEIWTEALGGSRPLALTRLRRQKYRAMYAEHLGATPDPRTAWRAVLFAVTKEKDGFYMKTRAYQLPESLLRNAERRDMWIDKAVRLIEAHAKKSTEAKSFAKYYRETRGAA